MNRPALIYELLLHTAFLMLMTYACVDKRNISEAFYLYQAPIVSITIANIAIASMTIASMTIASMTIASMTLSMDILLRRWRRSYTYYGYTY